MNTPGYTRTAIGLHWLVAGLIICAFAMGWVMTDLAFSPFKLRLFNWHKWLGVTILALAAIRLSWRLAHSPPRVLPMQAWQRHAATLVHVLLYLLMFALPLSGWIYSNASGYPIVYLGVLPLPVLVHKSKDLAGVWLQLHHACAWGLLMLFVLHAAAALKHHFIDGDDTLRRMLYAN